MFSKSLRPFGCRFLAHCAELLFNYWIGSVLRRDKEPILPTENESRQTRRTFFRALTDRIAMFCVAATALGRSGFSRQDKKSAALAAVKIADHPELEKTGGFVLVKDTAEGDLLIVKSTEEQYAAMSNVCPHKHCRVEVKSPTLIQCPCHGSRYKPDGTYISGPAKKSLKQFHVAIEGGVITVSAN